MAAGTLALAVARALPPALLGYACAGLGQMAVGVVSLTLFQRAVRDELRGRAFSIYNTVSHGVLLLVTQGAAALAALSQLLGVAGALCWLPRGSGDEGRRPEARRSEQE